MKSCLPVILFIVGRAASFASRMAFCSASNSPRQCANVSGVSRVPGSMPSGDGSSFFASMRSSRALRLEMRSSSSVSRASARAAICSCIVSSGLLWSSRYSFRPSAIV